MAAILARAAARATNRRTVQTALRPAAPQWAGMHCGLTTTMGRHAATWRRATRALASSSGADDAPSRGAEDVKVADTTGGDSRGNGDDGNGAAGLPQIKISTKGMYKTGGPVPRMADAEALNRPGATPLALEMETMILMRGPLTVAEYMRLALGHPAFGYYMKGDVFGKEGDFTTSPEISALFGELLGIWCIATWEQMGRPERFHLAEIGPGRGSLMDDLLRAARRFPAFYDAMCGVHFVETSPALQEVQKEKLECHQVGDFEYATKDGKPVSWYEMFTAVPPDAPLLLVAQELFDALPVHQFQMTDRGEWRERLIDVNTDEGRNHLRFVLSPGTTPGLIQFEGALKRAGKVDLTLQAQEGDIVEFSPASSGLAYEISRRIATVGGAAVFIDYGHDGVVGDTLRGIRKHEFVDPLEDTGVIDLSVDVDFAAIRDAASAGSCTAHGPITQSEFLQVMGIVERINALLEGATQEEGENLVAQAERLLSPEQMGSIYKVMAITEEGATPPIGFGGSLE